MFFLLGIFFACDAKPVSITVSNMSGRRVQVYWVTPGSLKRVEQTAKPTAHGSAAGINSFSGHEFVVTTVTKADTDASCEGWARRGECDLNPGYMLHECATSCALSWSFSVGDSEETFVLLEDGGLRRESAAILGREAIRRFASECGEVCGSCLRSKGDDYFRRKRKELELERKLYENHLLVIPEHSEDDNESMENQWREALASVWVCDQEDDVEKCAESAGEHSRALDASLRSLRAATRRRGQEMRNVTCAKNVETVPSTEYVTWENRRVRDLFYDPDSLPAARISLVENFVSKEECDAMIDDTLPRLMRATHANEGDLTAVSNVRDAQQAQVSSKLPASIEIQRRSVELANALSNYSLNVSGQEKLMAIQYLQGQQYMLHCDGSCDESPHVRGGRVATVLIYCRMGEGGATSFPNANVLVRPPVHSAVYFHFSLDGRSEPWHTEHSGCPVTAGEKWVVTQWLRAGVDSEHPASIFNPFGGLV